MKDELLRHLDAVNETTDVAETAEQKPGIATESATGMSESSEAASAAGKVARLKQVMPQQQVLFVKQVLLY